MHLNNTTFSWKKNCAHGCKSREALFCPHSRTSQRKWIWRGEGTRGRRYSRGAESGGTGPLLASPRPLPRSLPPSFAGRERKTRARTRRRGAGLRVMGVRIGPGTVSRCEGERERRAGSGEEPGRPAEARGRAGERASASGEGRRGARSGARTDRPGSLRRSAPAAAMVQDFRALPRLRAPLHAKIYFKTQLKETGRLHVTV